jgi:hypothetical protein
MFGLLVTPVALEVGTPLIDRHGRSLQNATPVSAFRNPPLLSASEHSRATERARR